MAFTKNSKFWQFIENNLKNEGCWNWPYYIYKKIGYPQVNLSYKGEKSRKYWGHRLSYTHIRGEIATGMTIDHLCKNKACLNPYHMEVVSLGENVKRMLVLKTKCPKGHEYSDENTIRRLRRGKYISRECKICTKFLQDIRNRRYYFKHTS